MTSWEKQEKIKGMQGLAIIVNPKAVVKETDDAKNNLLIAKTEADGTISYWTGFAWDQAGQIADQDAWKKYVSEFAQGVASPIEVTVSGE